MTVNNISAQMSSTLPHGIVSPPGGGIPLTQGVVPPPGLPPHGIPPGMVAHGVSPMGIPPGMIPPMTPLAPEKKVEDMTVPLDRGPEMPPRRTLYINNISCKVPTRQLRKDIISMASEYGKVVACVCMKSFWRRGQAYLSFSNQEEADKCYNELNNRPYAGQRLRVNYARQDTHVVAKELGTYVKREKEEGAMRPYSVRLKDDQMRQEMENQQEREETEGGNVTVSGTGTTADGTFQQAAQSRGGTSAYFFSRLAAAKQSSAGATEATSDANATTSEVVKEEGNNELNDNKLSDEVNKIDE